MSQWMCAALAISLEESIPLWETRGETLVSERHD